MGISGWSSTNTGDVTEELVAIISVDPPNRKAVGLNQRRSTNTIDLGYLVGGMQIIPAVGEQWYIERADIGFYRLVRQMPTDGQPTNDLVEGHVKVGSSGPLALSGSNILFNNPVSLPTYTATTRPPASDFPAGSVIYDSESGSIITSDGTFWRDLGGQVIPTLVRPATLDAEAIMPVPDIPYLMPIPRMAATAAAPTPFVATTLSIVNAPRMTATTATMPTPVPKTSVLPANVTASASMTTPTTYTDAVYRRSTGAGNSTTGSSTTLSTSWTDPGVTSSNIYTCVIVGVVISLTATGCTCSVTYGGVTMTELAFVALGTGTERSAIGLYRLFTPPTGAKTVQVSTTGAATKTAVAGQSAVYQNVGSTGTVQSSATTGVTVPSSVLDMAFAVTTNGAALSSPNQTSLYLAGSAVAGAGDYISVQDAPGAGSVSFTNSGTATTPTTYGVDLIAAPQAYVENISRSSAPVPFWVTTGAYVTLIGGGGRGGIGGNGAQFSGGPAGGGGGGGGGSIDRVFIPLASLGSTYSVGRGAGGSSTGAAGAASTFASGTVSMSAGGGSAGGAGSGNTNGSAGTGGTSSASGVSATTHTGGAGGAGNAAAPAHTGDDAAAGGGGGGKNTANGLAGGNSSTATGGAGSTSTGSAGSAGGSAAAGHGGAGGGGGKAGGSGSGSGGGAGGQYGAGGGGGGGGERGQGAGGSGADGYTLVEFV